MRRIDNEIVLDLDKNRIRSILSETYRAASELLNVEFDISEEDFVCQIEPFLISNRVSIPVSIRLPSRMYPSLSIKVDFRRAKVFSRIVSRARNHPKQVLLNRFLNSL